MAAAHAGLHLMPGCAEANCTGHYTPEQCADGDDMRPVKLVSQQAADRRERSLCSTYTCECLCAERVRQWACARRACTPALHRVMVPSCDGVAFRLRMMNRYTAGSTCASTTGCSVCMHRIWEWTLSDSDLFISLFKNACKVQQQGCAAPGLRCGHDCLPVSAPLQK